MLSQADPRGVLNDLLSNIYEAAWIVVGSNPNSPKHTKLNIPTWLKMLREFLKFFVKTNFKYQHSVSMYTVFNSHALYYVE